MKTFSKQQDCMCSSPALHVISIFARNICLLTHVSRCRITCGLYINISIHDYLKCLMGLHAKDTAWTLDPRIEIPGEDKTGVQRGTGNQVSVEFNLLYRFHSPISTRDRKWSENMFISLLSNLKDENGEQRFTDEQIIEGEVPVPVYKALIDQMNGGAETEKETIAKERKLPFLPAGLERRGENAYVFERDESGKFDDDQLVAEMCQVIEDPICKMSCRANSLIHVLSMLLE